MTAEVLQADVADDRRCLLGESPRWDVEGGRLVWVDVLAGAVLARPVTTARGAAGGSAGARTAGRTRWHVGGHVGNVLVRAGGGLVVARDRAVHCLDAAGRLEATLVEHVPGAGRGLRVNECAVDPDGRLVLGTTTTDQQPGAAALWRLEPSGELRCLLAGVSVSNGMAWSAGGRRMYYVDSPTGELVAHAYGDELGPGQVVARFEGGVPDGLCLDAEGGVWVAVHGAGEVRRYTGDGTHTHTVQVPARKATSCILVGDGPAQLYVTTAAVGLAEDELTDEPAAGLTFVAEVPTASGRPPVFPS